MNFRVKIRFLLKESNPRLVAHQGHALPLRSSGRLDIETPKGFKTSLGVCAGVGPDNGQAVRSDHGRTGWCDLLPPGSDGGPACQGTDAGLLHPPYTW